MNERPHNNQQERQQSKSQVLDAPKMNPKVVMWVGVFVAFMGLTGFALMFLHTGLRNNW